MTPTATTETIQDAAQSAIQTTPPAKRVRKANQSVQQTSPHPELVPSATLDNIMQIALDGAEISVNIPADAKLPEVLTTLNKVVQGLRTFTDASERLKPVVGRIILVVQERKMYKPDYRNMTEFIEQKIVGEMGLGRSTAFDALRVAKAHPGLTAAEYAQYGASRLLLLAKDTDSKQPNYLEVLHASLSKTVEEIKTEQKERAAAENPSTTVSITLHVSQTAKNKWVKLLKDTELEAPKLFNKLLEAYRAHPSEHKA